MGKLNLEEAELRVRILKAMAHPVRLIIIELLKDGELSFSEIKNEFDLDKSTISKHLAVLKDAGIVSSRKVGKETFFRLETPCAVEFFRCATRVIKENLEKQKSTLEGGNAEYKGP